MIPRIFGPYESLQGKAYTADEYRADASAKGFAQSVYVQANWTLEDSVKEVEWVHEQHERTGWPHAIVGSADLFAPDAIDTVEAELAAIAAACAASGCSCTGTSTRGVPLRLGPRPRRRTGTFNENLAQLPGLGLRVRAAGLPEPARRRRWSWSAAHPDLTFVLIHAGMPIAGEPWRDALHAARQHPQRQRQALRPGHVRPPRRPRADRAT